MSSSTLSTTTIETRVDSYPRDATTWNPRRSASMKIACRTRRARPSAARLTNRMPDSILWARSDRVGVMVGDVLPIRSVRSMGSTVLEDRVSWEETRRVALRRDGYNCAEGDRPSLDVHHRVPRSAGGTDEASNLVTLCDGCRARRHPNLQVSLSRRSIERWALRLARWLDRQRTLPDEVEGLSAALRLFGKERLRDGQLAEQPPEVPSVAVSALRSRLVIRPSLG